MANYTIGQKIHIDYMDDPYASNYTGREGEIRSIDGIGQLHGTWGGCALIPGVDAFHVISDPEEPPVATQEAKAFVPSKCMAQKAILVAELDAAIQVLENHGGRLGDAESIEYHIFYNLRDPEIYDEFVRVNFPGGAYCVRTVTGDSNSAVFQEVGKLLHGGYYSEVDWYDKLAASDTRRLLNTREIIKLALQANLL